MDNLQKLISQLRQSAFGVSFMISTTTAGLVWGLLRHSELSDPLMLCAIFGGIIILSLCAAHLHASIATEPIRFLQQAILHVSPQHHNMGAPLLEQCKIGRELVTSLALQVYQLASSQQQLTAEAPNVASHTDTQAGIVTNNLPLPIAVLDKNQNIVLTNTALSEYVGIAQKDIVHKSFYSVLDLSFANEHTLDRWLEECRANKITATNTWSRVRLNIDGKPTKQLDLVAYYSKNNPSNVEVIIALFDRTSEYQQDDQAMNYVALAVHELRTPLTVLRGYMEVFEEELEGKLTPELTTFMHRMQAAAQQLTSFVNNILSVARLEENQLTLELHQNNWGEILRHTAESMQLRASVHGKTITYDIAAELPSVGVDAISISEVLNNLLDNAIKYSDKSETIRLKSYLNQSGMIETTVQDFGVGIPGNIMGNLFEKFYRNHRSRDQVGGTGLGLYLSKAIVSAHGGEIWVRSKEGEGTTFGFTLQPFAKIASGDKAADNTDITRTAHGWIKNHSFYRR